MSQAMRDQVLAIKAVEVARANPGLSVSGVVQCALAEVRRLDEAEAVNGAWTEYARKYPSLGGL